MLCVFWYFRSPRSLELQDGVEQEIQCCYCWAFAFRPIPSVHRLHTHSPSTPSLSFSIGWTLRSGLIGKFGARPRSRCTWGSSSTRPIRVGSSKRSPDTTSSCRSVSLSPSENGTNQILNFNPYVISLHLHWSACSLSYSYSSPSI